jgi:hypothetical protein
MWLLNVCQRGLLRTATKSVLIIFCTSIRKLSSAPGAGGSSPGRTEDVLEMYIVD